VLAQSFSKLRRGEKAMGWINKLDDLDPLRVPLAKTAIVAYTNTNQIKKAATLLKSIVSKNLAKKSDINELSNFHMQLARLLYQVGQLEASKSYYELIPDESNQFIQAQAELLWVNLRLGNLSKLMGTLKSLEHNVFKDQFIPEAYLVGSIARLKMCEFKDVKTTMDNFISEYSQWLDKINKNIDSKKPSLVMDDFYLNLVKTAQATLNQEKEKLQELKIKSVEGALPAIGEQPHWKKSLTGLNEEYRNSEAMMSFELKRPWINRKLILKETIRKMRFVKVEYISLMRRIQRRLAKSKNIDSVSTFKSAPVKNNELKFSFDGVYFADELFNLTADVKSLCLKGDI
jgi:tetratricopeptide (TPR) repeat protein